MPKIVITSLLSRESDQKGITVKEKNHRPKRVSPGLKPMILNLDLILNLTAVLTFTRNVIFFKKFILLKYS